jgi:hypothetical protein
MRLHNRMFSLLSERSIAVAYRRSNGYVVDRVNVEMLRLHGFALVLALRSISRGPRGHRESRKEVRRGNGVGDGGEKACSEVKTGLVTKLSQRACYCAGSNEGSFTHHCRSKLLLLLPSHCVAFELLRCLRGLNWFRRHWVGLEAVSRLAAAVLASCAAHGLVREGARLGGKVGKEGRR